MPTYFSCVQVARTRTTTQNETRARLWRRRRKPQTLLRRMVGARSTFIQSRRDLQGNVDNRIDSVDWQSICKVVVRNSAIPQMEVAFIGLEILRLTRRVHGKYRQRRGFRVQCFADWHGFRNGIHMLALVHLGTILQWKHSTTHCFLQNAVFPVDIMRTLRRTVTVRSQFPVEKTWSLLVSSCTAVLVDSNKSLELG